MIDRPSAFLAITSLLFLSIVTIELCRKDGRRPASERLYLFEGKTFGHSLLSGLGAVFSVTYFFGATFMYSTVYGAWTLLIATVTFGTAYLAMKRILGAILEHATVSGAKPGQSHLLLDFLRDRLPRSHYRVLAIYLAALYFILLVEEIAISRVIVQSIFPAEPAVSTMLLSVILLVILAYLFIGGFRAVLNSDLVQGLILLAFLLVLGSFLFLVESPIRSLFQAGMSLPNGILIPSLFAWPLVAAAWLTMSLDFYARLNFSVAENKRLLASQKLLALSLLGSALIVTVGIVFASVHAGDLTVQGGPSQYFSDASQFFLGARAVAVRAIFLVALFSMIFTTIDTLAVTTLQTGLYAGIKLFRRSRLPLILLVATFLASIMPRDSVSAVGIFMASLMIPPVFSVAAALGKRPAAWWAPDSPLFLVIVPLVSGMSLLPFYHLLEKRFDLMFLIPSCTFVWTILVLLFQRSRGGRLRQGIVSL